ncbi:MAG: restriction endonuclease subunit S [Muribaculaceae bacterium]|nr:restriction endonuclease subunit S [Muribaculaceae bacterium]
MQSNYKRLGNYIRQVDVRNRDLAVDNLVGLTIEKAFIPSVANTIGTDLSNYKVISNGQFACSLMQVSRDGKMPIAMFKGEKGIMSPAYPMFEVYRKDELLPEFLMMWFSRKEFDREVTFWAVGGVRGSLTWEDFENLNIPVPPIEVQRKIVAEYQAVERRIENNRRLIATLEATAQTIYRKMFVDDIDPENLPQGWRMGKMKDLANFAYGRMPKEKDNGIIPVFSGYGVVGYCNEAMYDKQHIVVIARGDSGSGKIVKSPRKFYLTNLAIAIKLNNESYRDYLYYHLLSLDTSTLRTGSAQAQVTINSVEELVILIPPVDICANFYSVVDKIEVVKIGLAEEEEVLNDFSSLLLTKLSKL